MEPLNEIEKQFVEQILAEDLKFRGVESNLNFVLDAVERTDARSEHLTESKVRRAISDVAEKLCANAGYHNAFDQLYMQHPELNVIANEGLLVSAVQKAGGAITSENLEIVANDPAVKARLATTQAYKNNLAAEQAEQQHWTAAADKAGAMVVAMTAHLLGENGEPKGRTKWDKQIIQKRLDAETAALLALSFDELSEKHEAWLYKRRLESMTAAEVRDIVKADDLKRRATYTEFRPLPESYSPPNKETVFIPWSQQLLTKLPAAELFRLMQLYGSKQLNGAAAAAKGR
jgi:hypothetical protein